MASTNKLDKPAISPRLLSYVVAVIIIAALLAFLEDQVSKKSAFYLFILIILGMVLTDQFILIRVASLIDRFRSATQ